MRHFGYLSASETDALFEAPPEPFHRDSGQDLLSVALGATLYMPATRPALAADITKQAAAGVTSVVAKIGNNGRPTKHPCPMMPAMKR